MAFDPKLSSTHAYNPHWLKVPKQQLPMSDRPGRQQLNGRLPTVIVPWSLDTKHIRNVNRW
jgi:hypothetical protein